MTRADIINFQERARDYYDLTQCAHVKASRTPLSPWGRDHYLDVAIGHQADSATCAQLAREALCYELTEE